MVQNSLETSREPFWRVDVELGVDFTDKVVKESHCGVPVEDHVNKGPIEVLTTELHKSEEELT